MNIGAISSNFSLYSKMKLTNCSNWKTINNKQSITLKANKEINLGTINGKPFEMKIFQEGGFEWSGCPRIKAPKAGSRVTDEQLEAAYATRSYTFSEHKKAGEICAVINFMYLMQDKGWTTSSFNKYIEESNISQQKIEDAFSNLGINPNKPFNLKGERFILESGKLKNC